jgi:hypothetical protein
MPTKSNPKAVLVNFDEESAQAVTTLVGLFRSTAKLKDAAGRVKGLASYVLYGLDIENRQIVVLAEAPTAADFDPYVTGKATADACARYTYVVEYRDAGTHTKPKVKMLTWILAR